IRPDEARFVLGTTDGEILTSANGSAPRPTGLKGTDIAVAPDGQTLAYLRDGALYLYRDGGEKPLIVSGAVAGKITMPAWSSDGQSLAFVSAEAGGDSVYRLRLDTLKPSRLLTIPDAAAPPIFSPATGRLLIAERLDAHSTAFYTIDP